MLNVLLTGIAVIVPTAVRGAVFSAPRWIDARGERRRRRLRSRGLIPAPVGRPLERLAADLRRLDPQRTAAGRSRTQREAARLAYEDVLIEAAQALGISHSLANAPRGLPRELEMLRGEQALLDAGLVLGA